MSLRSALTPRNLRSGAKPSNCRISWKPCSIASKLRIALGQKNKSLPLCSYHDLPPLHEKYLHRITFTKKNTQFPSKIYSMTKTSRWIWQELELCRVSMVEVTKAAPSMWGKRLQTHGTFSQSLIWKVSPTKVTINANLGFENLKEIFRCFLHSSVLFVCFHTRHTPHNFAMSQWLHRTGVNKNLHTSLGHTARKGESRESRESKQSRAGFSERFPIDTIEVCRNEYKNYKTNAFYQLLSFFCFFSSLFLSFDKVWICEFCFWESDRCQWSLPKDERESARDLGKSANLVVVLPDLPTTAGAMVLLYLKTEQKFTNSRLRSH